MKKVLSLALSVALWGGVAQAQGGTDEASPAPPAPPTETAPAPNSLEGGLAQISAVQAMLEFFFMEAGVYPAELNEMTAAFNYQLPKGAKAVIVPSDPATGQPFVYAAAANKKSYKLRFPDPSKYGAPGSLELGAVNWGWLALRAERMRFEEMAKLSKYHMETLATSLEMYAKDNSRKFPPTLDPLYPKYINRFPQDPITGKNYDYKVLADGYTIANPNPQRYGLKLFQYSSTRGMEVEALAPGEANASAPASAPKPKPR